MTAGESAHADCALRVVNIYATPWRFDDRLSDTEGTPPDLSGLEPHYALYKEQLPQLLPERVIGEAMRAGDVTLAGPVPEITVEHGRAELFTLPSKQVVLTVSMCLAHGDLADGKRAGPVAEVLEQCIIGEVRIGTRKLQDALTETFLAKAAERKFTREMRGDPLLPERHQLVFVARSADGRLPTQEVIDKVLYRDTPPYRPEFVDPKLPEQLNTHPDGSADSEGAAVLPTLGVVTPYVSLLYGHREYVEASTFLSTVHAVGTAARFRYIWRQAYQQVLRFREQKQKAVAGQQTRDDLELLADNLGNLEFDLTFSVEFPLMRIETFQTDLYNAMDLESQADALSRMFAQIGGSLRSEITAIEVREGRRRESRQVWNSIAAGLLSLIGVPVGFVVAFLSISTTEVVNPPVSMWDARYATLYLVASAFALTPVYLIGFPYLKDLTLPRDDARALWAGVCTIGLGAVIFAWAMAVHGGRTVARVLDAIATAGGVFVLVVGLTLIGFWVGSLVRRAREKRRNALDEEYEGRYPESRAGS